MQPLTASQQDFLERTVVQAVRLGATIALEEAGLIKDSISYAEIRKMHGSAVARDARVSTKIKWIPNGKGGKKAGIYCRRSEWEEYRFSKQFDYHRP